MNVLQVLPGQSPSVMQPLPALAPPTHAPVSHDPVGQSGSPQQIAPVSLQRPVSLTHVPPGQEPAAVVPQPPPPAQGAPGVVPPEQRIERMSPSRKSRALRGRFTV